MEKVVYLTAVAEARCQREIDRADMIGEIYGAWNTAERIRAKAYERLEPYRRIWWDKELAKEVSAK
jgi:hypothetical protein